MRNLLLCWILPGILFMMAIDAIAIYNQQEACVIFKTDGVIYVMPAAWLVCKLSGSIQ